MASACVSRPKKISNKTLHNRTLDQLIGNEVISTRISLPPCTIKRRGSLNTGFFIGSGSAAPNWLRPAAVFPTGWPVEESACPTPISSRMIAWGSTLLLFVTNNYHLRHPVSPSNEQAVFFFTRMCRPHATMDIWTADDSVR
jgi:hypothetical protein